MDNKSITVLLLTIISAYISFSVGRIYEKNLVDEQVQSYIKTVDAVSDAFNKLEVIVKDSKCLSFRSLKHSR